MNALLFAFLLSVADPIDPREILGMPRPQDYMEPYTERYNWEQGTVTTQAAFLLHLVTRLKLCGHPVELTVEDVGDGDLRVSFAQWAAMVRIMWAHPQCWLTAKGGARI